MTTRRHLAFSLTGALLLAAFAFAPAAQAQDFPNKPIHLVVPFPPGGLTDVTARKLADLVARDLGQPIVVENKPGANGAIGTTQVTRAPADGYTLVMVTTTTALVAPLLTKTPYDPLRDLAFLLNYAGPSHALLVKADSPYGTFDQLIADARANPGKLSFGSVGTSDTVYFGMMALSKAKNVKFNHIPYQGASQTLMAALSGEVTFSPASNYFEQVKSGKLRALAVLDRQRFAGMPDVPTFTELGIDWQFPWITGIAAPAATPPAVLAKLETAFLKAARDPSFAQLMSQLNVPLYLLDGAALRQDLVDKIASYGKQAREYGMMPP
ncbi:MAG: tripartite tricarboxylate transporter substrate binding protein [Sulfuricaulis sp.]|nr:tripartite tricarboxylate transporter substrate binding protein [Sulfuricaulis sp.]